MQPSEWHTLFARRVIEREPCLEHECKLHFLANSHSLMMSEMHSLLPQGTLPVSWLIPYLLSRGICGNDLCARLDLKEDQLLSEDATASVENYLRLFEWASRHLNDPDTGLKLGNQTEASQFGLLGYIIANASTIRDLGRYIDSYHKIFSASFDVHARESENLCSLELEIQPLAGSETRQEIDCTFSILAKEIRRNVGEHWKPEYCSFTYSKPADVSELRRVFGSDLRFGQPENRMVFSRNILEVKVRDADSSLLKICRQLADMLILKSGPRASLSQQVNIILSSLIGKQKLSADIVATALNLTVRGMHRELRNEGTSFRALRKTILHQAAQELLDGTNVPVSDIALHLGYSETSALNRAFKREEGESPLRYRHRKHLNGA